MAARGLSSGAEGLAKLPRIKCPRSGTLQFQDESPRLNQRSPRTPRRRDGRLSAGAAFSLFFRSPVSSPGGAFDPRSAVGPFQPSNQQPSNDPSSSTSSYPLLPWLPSLCSFPAKYDLASSHHISSALSSHALAFPTSPSSSSILSCGLRGSSPRSRSRQHCLGNKRVSAEARDPRVEASETANEDLLLFFYQLDLNMRLQRALNQDQYEPAQQLREKISEVEREIARLRDAKLGGVSSKDDAQDKGITLLSLKAELSRAIGEEQYEVAAELRNKITKLESDTLAASAAALASQNREYKFRLGQRVRHEISGYMGLVAGMDPVCCETAEWREAAGLSPELLTRPFYQVLVDVKENLGFPVAYVSEASLEAPEEPCKDRFDHPYVYLLFLGMDARGDFIPCQQLREKYNAPRHEVPEDDGQENGD